MNRRSFLSLSAAACADSPRRVRSRRHRPSAVQTAGDDIPIGKSRLGIADDFRAAPSTCLRRIGKGVPMPIPSCCRYAAMRRACATRFRWRKSTVSSCSRRSRA